MPEAETVTSHRIPAIAPASAREVFRAFLALGLTSFGGPIAHLGYLRREFVQRRGWLDETHFAQLLAVCQFLPGPASSQMSFALGLFRAGWRGALAAFVAFTLPSAGLMFGFALLAPHLDAGLGAALVHGLKLVAVAVVAQGLFGMIRTLTPDVSRALIGLAAMAVVLGMGSAWAQLVAIAAGGLLGPWLCRQVRAPDVAMFPVAYGGRGAAACLAAFVLLLAASLCVPDTGVPTLAGVGAAFYRAGALVFGGGHVVLPLLQHAMVDPGWISRMDFLAGYGAAQALPGPMFSLAAFLGAKVPTALPAAIGASVAVLGIFLPGFLILLAVLPVWSRWAQRRWAAGAIAGINAAVVGLLAAAFYDPVWTTGVCGPFDVAIAALGFLALVRLRVSPLWIVLGCVAAAMAAAALGVTA